MNLFRTTLLACCNLVAQSVGPADRPLYAQERRPECNGSVRVLYAARVGHCRACPLRERCQGYGTATKKPRRVSAVLWPLDEPPPEPAIRPVLPPASHPILWGDWSRCRTRREWIDLLRTQRVDVCVQPAPQADTPVPPSRLSRPQRAHWRLSWAERLARNARAKTSPTISFTLFGVPPVLAAFLDLSTI